MLVGPDMGMYAPIPSQEFGLNYQQKAANARARMQSLLWTITLGKSSEHATVSINDLLGIDLWRKGRKSLSADVAFTMGWLIIAPVYHWHREL